MKKLLTATTALALVGGAAFAEITMSGDGEFGVLYGTDMEPNSHSFHHEVGIDFTASGSTDGGLSFGGSAGFDTQDDAVNDGSTYISGAFGKLSIGDVGRGNDLAGGIADVGELAGINVDDLVEDLTEGSDKSIRYEHSLGDISFAASAGNNDDGDNQYAVGMSFTASGMRVGLGWDSTETISLGAGYTIDQITANALYVREDDGDSGMGGDLAYTLGATTLTLVFAQEDIGGVQNDGMGVNVSHDLGGGARVVAGFGMVPNADRTDDVNGAEVGLKFSF